MDENHWIFPGEALEPMCWRICPMISKSVRSFGMKSLVGWSCPKMKKTISFMERFWSQPVDSTARRWLVISSSRASSFPTGSLVHFCVGKAISKGTCRERICTSPLRTRMILPACGTIQSSWSITVSPIRISKPCSLLSVMPIRLKKLPNVQLFEINQDLSSIKIGISNSSESFNRLEERTPWILLNGVMNKQSSFSMMMISFLVIRSCHEEVMDSMIGDLSKPHARRATLMVSSACWTEMAFPRWWKATSMFFDKTHTWSLGLPNRFTNLSGSKNMNLPSHFIILAKMPFSQRCILLNWCCLLYWAHNVGILSVGDRHLAFSTRSLEGEKTTFMFLVRGQKVNIPIVSQKIIIQPQLMFDGTRNEETYTHHHPKILVRPVQAWSEEEHHGRKCHVAAILPTTSS